MRVGLTWAIIYAGGAFLHAAVGGEFPMLDAVGTVLFACCIVPCVAELHGDLLWRSPNDLAVALEAIRLEEEKELVRNPNRAGHA